MFGWASHMSEALRGGKVLTAELSTIVSHNTWRGTSSRPIWNRWCWDDLHEDGWGCHVSSIWEWLVDRWRGGGHQKWCGVAWEAVQTGQPCMQCSLTWWRMSSAFCSSSWISCSLRVVASRISVVCLAKAVVLSMRSTSVVWVTNWCSRQSISVDLVLACDMYDSWVVPHEAQSKALNAWWHLVEFHCAEERDQWLVVCFHSEVEAQHVVTEPFTGPGCC